MNHEINRVLVPLDAVSETRIPIDTGAHLAARWRVPLHGIFVEDEELVSFASLPFARQAMPGLGFRPLTKDHLDDYFRAFAERARQELKTAAERHGVKWSFEVVRGPLAGDALCASEHDFVVAGATTRPIGGYFDIPSRWCSISPALARPLLLARREWQTGGSVLALLRRRGPEAAQAIDIAAQIASFCSGVLTVASTAEFAGSDELSAWVSQLLAGHSLTVRTEAATIAAAALRQRITELDCRLLVAISEPETAGSDELREALKRLQCDVLIVP
jgi:hypothetical protein